MSLCLQLQLACMAALLLFDTGMMPLQLRHSMLELLGSLLDVQTLAWAFGVFQVYTCQ